MIGGTPFVPTPIAWPRRAGAVKSARSAGADPRAATRRPKAEHGEHGEHPPFDGSEHRGTQKT